MRSPKRKPSQLGLKKNYSMLINFKKLFAEPFNVLNSLNYVT